MLWSVDLTELFSAHFEFFFIREVETGRLNAYGSDTDFFVQGLSISRARDLI